MEENEILKEQIEKLNGRLQKAITVFGEQKANIERLTNERDTAQNECEKLRSRINELEKKELEASENDSKFFEQLKEIDELNAKIKSIEVEYNSLKATDADNSLVIQQVNQENVELNEAINMLKKDYDSMIEEYDSSIADLNKELIECKEYIDKYNAEHDSVLKLENEIASLKAELAKKTENTQKITSNVLGLKNSLDTIVSNFDIFQ